MKRIVILALTHLGVLALGFGLGVYFLPILTAPPAPEAEVLAQEASEARFSAQLTRDLRGSDALHWGEGTISVTEDRIVHQGELAPGPDYVVYLAKDFVEHEDEFEPVKADAVKVGAVKTFDGFLVDVPDGIDVSDFTTVVIWCETFGEFITAARYR